MKKKYKIGVIVLVAVIIISGGILIWYYFTQSDRLEYTVIEKPDDEMLEIYAPCLMEYWDDVSVYVGKAKSPDDVVDKWASNVGKLKEIYRDAYYYNIYGNFSWTNRPKTLQIKYRTSREGYSRDGWYIFTSSPSFLEEGNDYGEFFLSDDGMLMPAVRATALLSCP